ncbi:hypothetical protein SBA7_570003 [Candidatus Sulfotelmatobacter sp. SbA7]|nr:hypothetical protein SBA7_570003 [Candidatus Sulfotelmatobacter sp. SbA7]
MNVYVLGAGVSKSVGYPLGRGLFEAIDRYVRTSGNCFDRFDYQKGWSELQHWLETNPNPAITQAHRDKDIERLFTALDFATLSDSSDPQARDYQYYRGMLLWALENYFAWRHSEDGKESKREEWDALTMFAKKLKPKDVVITFNYDASLERVLLAQGKWSPRDGYGFELAFQKSRDDETPIVLPESPIVILHLHGATGWYRRPLFAPGFSLPLGHHGATPRQAFGLAPTNTKISIDPQFLQSLGIWSVDACLPTAPIGSDERHVVLHPSYLKDYENDGSGSHVFVELWRRAAKALRDAEGIYIVGYSLPKADSAALTLLLTNSREGIVRVVNPSGRVKLRLGTLFRSGGRFDGAATFEEWVSAGCPGRVPWRPRMRETMRPGL